MKRTQDREKIAAEYDTSADTLIARRSMLLNGVSLNDGDTIPVVGINPFRLRQLVRTGRAEVVRFGQPAPVVAPPAPAKVESVAAVESAFVCDFPGCAKPPFNSKLKLASHARVHKE